MSKIDFFCFLNRTCKFIPLTTLTLRIINMLILIIVCIAFITALLVRCLTFNRLRIYHVSFRSKNRRQVINLSSCQEAIVKVKYLPIDLDLLSELSQPQIRGIDLRYNSIIPGFSFMRGKVQNIRFIVEDCLPGARSCLIIRLENMKVSNIVSVSGDLHSCILVFIYLDNSEIHAASSTKGANIVNVSN